MNENSTPNHTNSKAGRSTDSELDDLECLNFPGDVDWSATVVLRCDPAGCPYKLSDVIHGLHHVVRRNDVYNLGSTSLNHAFILSFKTDGNLENFVRYLKNPRMQKGLMVKGHPCTFTRVPSKCAHVTVRWIPLEVDSAHITNILSQYGTIVKTEWIRSNFRGWFHVYTNERKITINLNADVNADDLPFTIEVKGLIGGVMVDERQPKNLECFYSGHSGDFCKYKDCLLYKPTFEKEHAK